MSYLHYRAIRQCGEDTDPALLFALQADGDVRRLEPGEPLWRVGVPPEQVVILCEGAALVRTRAQEQLRAEGIELPGVVLGMDPSFWSAARTTELVALTPVVAHLTSRSRVHRVLLNGGPLALAAARVFARACPMGTPSFAFRTPGTLRERIARLCCLLLDACAEREPAVRTCFSLPVLAELLASDVEPLAALLASPPWGAAVEIGPDGIAVRNDPALRTVTDSP